MSLTPKILGALAGLFVALAAPAARADVNVSIYQSSGQPSIGSYGPLVGSFSAPEVNFGSALNWYWTPLGQNGDFAAVVTGVLNVASAGTYSFGIASDDGSVLSIDGTAVIDAWYMQGPTARSGDAILAAGSHAFRIDYFECCGNPMSGLEMTLPRGVTYAPVPEPENYALMLAGLGVLGSIARRRKA